MIHHGGTFRGQDGVVEFVGRRWFEAPFGSLPCGFMYWSFGIFCRREFFPRSHAVYFCFGSAAADFAWIGVRKLDGLPNTTFGREKTNASRPSPRFIRGVSARKI